MKAKDLIKLLETVDSDTEIFIYEGDNIVNKFIAHIAAFPSGSGVRLNTNERCLVIRQNQSFPLRPVVALVLLVALVRSTKVIVIISPTRLARAPDVSAL